MSGPPPPPQVSADGKFYWDGRRWVPVALAAEAGMSPTMPVSTAQNVGCVTRTTCLTLVGMFALVAVVLLIAGVCSSIQH
jgi:hypothetical protein